MKQNYAINYETKEITITKTFAKKASQLNTPEARLMRQLRNEYKDFSFVYRQIETKENKESYAGLNMETMENFFKSRIRVEKAANENEPATTEKLNSEQDYEAFKNVKKVVGKGKYATVKKWFLDNFKEEYSNWSITDEYKKVA